MYNTPIEIHIAIDQALQYINTNRKNELRSEEKDWLFNETMMSMVDGIVSSKVSGIGFEDNMISYDALRPLKTLRTLEPMNVIQGVAKYRIPSGYQHFTAIGVEVRPTCGPKVTVTIDNAFTAVVKLGSGGQGSPFFKSFELKLSGAGGSIVIPTYTINNVNGYSSNEMKYLLISAILSWSSTSDVVDIYWETDGSTYVADSFIIVTSRHTYDTATIVYGYGTTGETTGYSDSFTSEVMYDEIVPANGSMYKPTTVITTESKYDMLDNVFATTDIDKPLVTLDRNIISVYQNADFVALTLNLEYLNKPRLLNKNAGIMTNLSNISNEIVQRTVQAIKARTDDPAYKAIINENMLNQNI